MCGLVDVVVAVAAPEIERVELRIDDALLESDAAPPFGATWNTRGGLDGAHTLEAATFGQGRALGSARISVLVDNTAAVDGDALPTIELASPADGAHVTGLVPLVAHAADGGEGGGVVRVTFFIDDGQLTVDESVPFATEWDSTQLAEGGHRVVARATDTVGQIADARVELLVDRTPPGLEVLQPAPDAVLSATLPFEVEPTDDRAVAAVLMSLQARDEVLGEDLRVAHLAAPPWSGEMDVADLPSGWYALRAAARDRAGNEAEARVEVLLDRPPSVRIVEPSEGDTLGAESVRVMVEASDDLGVPAVALFDDEAWLADLDGGGEALWTPSYEHGPHTLRAVATDASGQRVEDALTVTVDHPLEITLWQTDAPGERPLNDDAEVPPIHRPK